MKLAIKLPGGSGLKEMLQRLLQGGQELGGRAVQGTKNFVNPMLDLPRNVRTYDKALRMRPLAEQQLRFYKKRGLPPSSIEDAHNVVDRYNRTLNNAQSGIDKGKRNLTITGGGVAGVGGAMGINELVKAVQDKQASAPDFMKLAIGAAPVIKGIAKGMATAPKAPGFVRSMLDIGKNKLMLSAGNSQLEAMKQLGLSGSASQVGRVKRLEDAISQGRRNMAITGAGALGLGGVGAGAYGLGSHRGYAQGGEQGFNLGQQQGLANAANAQQQSGFLSRLMDMFAPSGNRSLQGAQLQAWDPRLLRVMREQARAAR